MADALSRVDLVVLLSERETHPIAVLEALALGRSVLVADTPGLHELAQQGLARAIPLDSAAAVVADAALEQLRRPLHPIGAPLLSWDQTAAGLLRLYHEVQGDQPCAS